MRPECLDFPKLVVFYFLKPPLKHEKAFKTTKKFQLLFEFSQNWKNLPKTYEVTETFTHQLKLRLNTFNIKL